MSVRGWCPGLYDPMASGDGLLVRVKPPGARLTPAAAAALAAGAERYGNGMIELTQRGLLQVRGLRAGTVMPFAAAMVAAGLAHADPVRERRRRVIASPPFDPALVAALEAMQEASTDWDTLPDKFAVSVNSRSGDLSICGDETGLGGDLATDTPAIEAVGRLTATCLTLGGGRMRALVEQRGEATIFAAAGLPTRPATHPAAPPPASLGVPFGQLSAATMAGLGALGVDLLLSPDRSIVVPDGAPLAAIAGRLGLIADPADPRRHVAACAGAPACASASVATRADAARWATLVPGLHVSGCAKGCAHPGPAAVTLVGREGRYDLVRHGRAGDAPVLRGLAVADIAAVLAAP